jgi:hypothetical protein
MPAIPDAPPALTPAPAPVPTPVPTSVLPSASAPRPAPGDAGDAGGAIAARLAAQDWAAVAAALDGEGWAVLPGLLGAGECAAVAALYDDAAAAGRFRSRVDMARHGFGRGAYRYFAYPLPPLVAALRCGLYAELAGIAERWAARMGRAGDYPADHAAYLARCRAAGQARPTPLLLDYGAGDYNCLHQDIYGAEHFPLQAAVLLSRPGGDFEGGEFVLTEQRPRMQSRTAVVPLGQGDAVIFAVRERPVRGSRGDYRVAMRHGVSAVRSGRRRVLGVILHDAT